MSGGMAIRDFFSCGEPAVYFCTGFFTPKYLAIPRELVILCVANNSDLGWGLI
jgi:hypothetical protein